MKNAPVKSAGAKDHHILNVPSFHSFILARCLCLSAVGFKQKRALMAEPIFETFLDMSKIYWYIHAQQTAWTKKINF